MSEVTRFDKDMDGSMEPTSDGRWVRSDDYDALRAEHDALVHEMEGLRRKLDEALTERDAMGAERDALRADAERYRWLRDRWFIEGGLFPWKGLDLHHDGFPPISHFDEAIDAARARGSARAVQEDKP